MIRLALIAEVQEANTDAEAQAALDLLREQAGPHANYGIVLVRMRPADLPDLKVNGAFVDLE